MSEPAYPTTDLQSLTIGFVVMALATMDGFDVSVSPTYDARGNYLDRIVVTGNESGTVVTIDVKTADAR